MSDANSSTRGNRFQDLTGLVYGRLLVSEFSHASSGKMYWLCVCSCGRSAVVVAGNLRSGHARSCGCLQREARASVGKENRTHGKHRTPEYRTWAAMLHRCTNPNANNYRDYGGRGISVCESWKRFENFYAYMGPRPSPKHSIDRIDNDGNYEPGNCRWASNRQQNRNTRSNVCLSHQGKTQCIAAWAEELDAPVQTIFSRVKRGWSIGRIVATPIQARTSMAEFLNKAKNGKGKTDES